MGKSHQRILAVLALFFLFHAILPNFFNGVNSPPVAERTVDFSDFAEEDENSDLNLKFFSPPLVTMPALASARYSPLTDSTIPDHIEEIPTPPPC